MSHWPPETWLLAGALLVLLAFHAYMFAPFVFRSATVEPDRDLPVSVVICARNAAHDLQRLIPLLMDQDHHAFEVVVVNDRSDDDTWMVLDELRRRYPDLRPVNIQADEKFSYGKKLALGVGIRAARHPHVLLTDADCTPAGRDWIATMAAGFRNTGPHTRTIVVGNSPYAAAQGVVNVLERYDGSVKTLQYMAFAGSGFPYMGVGRNLAYTSEVFLGAHSRVRGRHLMSGDDDLLINTVATRTNTAVVADPRSFMTTAATTDLATWVRRKRRHYTTASHYRPLHQVLLMLLPLANVALWAALVWLAVRGEWTAFLIGAGIKLAVLMPITIAGLRRLGAGTIAWFALPLEWLFLLLDPLLYASALIVKPERWK